MTQTIDHFSTYGTESIQDQTSRYGFQKIQIQLLDSLAESTTYTFNFGESIVDNNEGNIRFFATLFPRVP